MDAWLRIEEEGEKIDRGERGIDVDRREEGETGEGA